MLCVSRQKIRSTSTSASPFRSPRSKQAGLRSCATSKAADDDDDDDDDRDLRNRRERSACEVRMMMCFLVFDFRGVQPAAPGT
eukprot:1165552-Rhodomonas_salina.1